MTFLSSSLVHLGNRKKLSSEEHTCSTNHVIHTTYTCTYNAYTCTYTYIYMSYTCMYMYMLFVYCVCTNDIHVYTVYGHCLYLYSFACLHNKSSVGVNRFSSSSVILGRNQPSIAAACDIVFPDLATGTGSLLSNECSSWYPDRSCCSKQLTNLPMASSISAASGLASIHTVYIGLHNLKPHWLCIYIACTMVIHVYTLYVHVMYMFYDVHTVSQHHIYNFLPFCPMLVDRNLQFCT